MNFCAEQNLWLAVVKLTARDIEECCKRIANIYKKNGRVSMYLKFEFDALINEIYDPWFEHICGFIDTHPDRIRNFAKLCAKTYGIYRVKYQNEPHRLKDSALKQLFERPEKLTIKTSRKN